MKNLILSPLNHTWLLDLDGTILVHNGYKNDGEKLLPNAKAFIESIPEDDAIVFVTSRTDEFKEATIKFLNENNIRFNHIIFNLPYGERILINDNKPSGLKMSKAINIKRDKLPKINIIIDEKL